MSGFKGPGRAREVVREELRAGVEGAGSVREEGESKN